MVSAQGWERVYGGSGQDDLSGIASTPDGGFVMTGYYNAESQVYLLKVDANGDLQFNKKFPLFNLRSTGRAVIVTQDGGYAVAGYAAKPLPLPADPQRDFCLLKTDAAGNLLWAKTYGSTTGNEEANDLVELADGSLVLAGYRKSGEDVMVVKTDANGVQIGATRFFGKPAAREMGNSIALAPNGDVVVVGEYKATTGSNSEVLVIRLDASIDTIWQRTYDAVPQVDDVAWATTMANDGGIVMAGKSYGNGLVMKVPGNGGAQLWVNADADSTGFYGLDKDLDGGYYACGFRDISGAQTDLRIVRFNAQGDVIWSQTVGRPGLDIGKSAVTTRDGGVVVAGASEPFYDQSGSGQPDGYLVKADRNGLIFTSYLRGTIFRDFSGNCTLDDGEPPLRDWIIKASSPQLTRYTISRGDGSYQIAVDTGTYGITLITPNDYWKTCNGGTLPAILPNFGDTAITNIPIRGEYDAPRNEVDVATPLLNRCADNTYTVRYCNSGTIPSLSTEVIVHLDTFLTLTGSSIGVVPMGSNKYKFNVGTLANGDCGNFTLTAFLGCDNTLTGQTHCTTAHIYPDSFYNPGNWNGAFVEARAACDGDTVRLYLKNSGISPTTEPSGYVIAEDVIMLTAPNDPNNMVSLDAAEELQVYRHAANGLTYRVIASQEPTYPGVSTPTAAVEGCITDTTSGPVSLGFYTMFPEDDGDAFVASDCQESYETDYNPTYLKRGHPKGYDVAQHYVSPETDLDFLIRFTNTGTDTVQQITIRDTLSAALDPATVHPGAASHPYQLDIYGDGIVQFTLPNVNLAPDSSANEGYVRFRVSQKPNLDPCGTVIFNSAAIYFDYNAPQYTNETFHTVCPFDSFVVVKTTEYFVPNASLKVYPNPMTDGATFELQGVDARSYRLDLYDLQGRRISSETFNQPAFQLFRHQLPAGLILYRLTADGQPVAAGKLLVQSRE